MCQGVPIFANNKKALYGKGTNSHSTSASRLKIDEDKYRKFEYLWWEKKLINAHYDQTAEDILKKINPDKADQLAKALVKKEFNTDIKLAKWLKDVPNEWDKLLEPKFEKLAKQVNPKLVYYSKKIKGFKYTDKKFNPYQATKLPTLKQLKKQKYLAQVWDQVGNQVWNQVGNQVGDQVRNQVWAQVWDQVWNQVEAQVRAQVWATSYWAVKIQLGLPIKHWFFDFLKLGVMIVFVKGKVKVFGKKGKYLGEYTEKELFGK